jgi:hypothetical protein
VAECPHPGAALRPDSIKEENGPDDDAIFEHVVIFVGLLPGRARGRRAFEDQWRHGRVSDAARRLTQR